VVGIVEPDGDEIADPADAGTETGIAVHQRQLRDRRLANLRKALGRQCLPRDVGHHLGEIADPPLGVDNSGLLAAAWAEANQLHGALSFWIELKSRWRRGADHASAPCVGQASRRIPAPRAHERYSKVCRANGSSDTRLLPIRNTSSGLFQKRPIIRFLRLQSEAAPDRITSCT
jgi:hypothetical protein